MPKPMGMDRIKMYVSLVEKEFESLLCRAAMAENLEPWLEEAKRNVGLWQVEAEIAALESKLNDLHRRQRDLKDRHYDYTSSKYVDSIVVQEAKRLRGLNGDNVYDNLVAKKEEIIKSIQLAEAPAEVQELFAGLRKELAGFIPALEKVEASRLIAA